ncbi:MAG TPA: hypothetical protein VGI90_16435 [Steroidobacteraceae bacterium]
MVVAASSFTRKHSWNRELDLKAIKDVQKPKKLAVEIPTLIYTPTLVAYVWIVVGWVVAGVALYLIAVFVTYKSRAFESLSQWPMLPKLVLYEGALFILFALVLSTQPTQYWMIIPLGLQGVISVIAWVSLAVDAKSAKQ